MDITMLLQAMRTIVYRVNETPSVVSIRNLTGSTFVVPSRLVVTTMEVYWTVLRHRMPQRKLPVCQLFDLGPSVDN